MKKELIRAISLRDCYCWTWGSKCFHIPVFVRSSSLGGSRGYTRSLCGVIDSATFAHFWIYPKAEDRHNRLRPCKRCFGSGEEVADE